MVSKDEDFFIWAMRPGDDGRLLWLRMGNCRTADLLSLPNRRWSEIVQAFEVGPGDRLASTIRDDRVEISRAEPIDIEFHRAQEANLADEWMAAEDEAAYGQL